METVEKKQSGTSHLVEGLKALNSEGCRFFIDANPQQETLITSSRLRWLSIREKKGAYFTDELNQALQRIAQLVDLTDANHLNIRILLYRHPRRYKRAERDVVVDLLRCGGTEIRYLKNNDQLSRLALRGGKLFLSTAARTGEAVNQGIVYESFSPASDPLLESFHASFEADFAKAKRLVLNKNGKIAYADSTLRLFVRWVSSEKGLAVIGTIVGIVGLLIALL